MTTTSRRPTSTLPPLNAARLFATLVDAFGREALPSAGAPDAYTVVETDTTEAFRTVLSSPEGFETTLEVLRQRTGGVLIRETASNPTPFATDPTATDPMTRLCTAIPTIADRLFLSYREPTPDAAA